MSKSHSILLAYSTTFAFSQGANGPNCIMVGGILLGTFQQISSDHIGSRPHHRLHHTDSSTGPILSADDRHLRRDDRPLFRHNRIRANTLGIPIVAWIGEKRKLLETN